MFGLGLGEVIVILFLALIFIGPKKLPGLARGLGKGFREFQKAKSDFMTEMHRVEEPIKDAVESVRLTARETAQETAKSIEENVQETTEKVKASSHSPEASTPPVQ